MSQTQHTASCSGAKIILQKKIEVAGLLSLFQIEDLKVFFSNIWRSS